MFRVRYQLTFNHLINISSPSLTSKWAYGTYATCGVAAKLPG